MKKRTNVFEIIKLLIFFVPWTWSTTQFTFVPQPALPDTPVLISWAGLLNGLKLEVYPTGRGSLPVQGTPGPKEGNYQIIYLNILLHIVVKHRFGIIIAKTKKEYKAICVIAFMINNVSVLVYLICREGIGYHPEYDYERKLECA